MQKKLRIGDLLVDNNVITQNQLDQALSEQKKTKLKLGRILVDLGFVEEKQLLDTLSGQLGVPFFDLKFYEAKPHVIQLLPEAQARRFRAIVLEDKGNRFLVGMVDPSDLFASDEIARILKKPIEQAIVRESDLLKTYDVVYRRTDEITSLAEELESELADDSIDIAQLDWDKESDAPVVRLLQSIFADAVQVKASDIHIEPDEQVLRIRQRVDGVLQEHVVNEKRIAQALVLRLKLMANLDIAEKRLPQDGRFHIKVQDHALDVRISTLPIQFGESVVMRLLDQTGGQLSLDDLGMPSELLASFRQQFQRPHGMLLVTGPTGSGKTTTLYGALSELNKAEKKIITAEDPVEYRLPRINQVQVNEKIGLRFGNVLRSALRQDPDVVMVGEIRDQETAEIALRASMTGHLVLSTLHTNDAISTALRLIDMGAEGYLVASALRGIVAQRLVRRLCEHCSVPYMPTTQERQWLTGMGHTLLNGSSFQHGEGCSHCNNTGYRGRVGVYEFLIMDDAMASALRRNDHDAFAKAAKSLPGFKSIVDCALAYAHEGVTSLEEVFRVSETLEELEDEYHPHTSTSEKGMPAH